MQKRHVCLVHAGVYNSTLFPSFYNFQVSVTQTLPVCGCRIIQLNCSPACSSLKMIQVIRFLICNTMDLTWFDFLMLWHKRIKCSCQFLGTFSCTVIPHNALSTCLFTYTLWELRHTYWKLPTSSQLQAEECYWPAKSQLPAKWAARPDVQALTKQLLSYPRHAL